MPTIHMRLQVSTLIEALFAAKNRAFIRLFPCVDADMGLQVEVDGEPLLAVGALERPLACVD